MTAKIKHWLSRLRPTDMTRSIAALLLFSSIFAVFEIGAHSDRYRPPIEAIGHALAYYTVVANLLLSLESALILLGRPPAARPGYRGCAVYAGILMFVVCLSMDIGNPALNSFNADLVIAHILNPVLIVLLSLRGARPARYRARDVFTLLLPAFLWVVFVMIRGSLFGEYPYVWIDPNIVGTANMYQNLLWLCGTAIFMAFAFVAFSQRRFGYVRRATVNHTQRRRDPARRAPVAIRSRLAYRDRRVTVVEKHRPILLA